MQLEWSLFAYADREAIFDYIEAENPPAAAAVDDAIREQVQRLAEFPEMGRVGRVQGTRELVIQNTPYIVAYRARKGVVRILRVLHGARLWPDEMPKEKS